MLPGGVQLGVWREEGGGGGLTAGGWGHGDGPAAVPAPPHKCVMATRLVGVGLLRALWVCSLLPVLIELEDATLEVRILIVGGRKCEFLYLHLRGYALIEVCVSSFNHHSNFRRWYHYYSNSANEEVSHGEVNCPALCLTLEPEVKSSLAPEDMLLNTVLLRGDVFLKTLQV